MTAKRKQENDRESISPFSGENDIFFSFQFLFLLRFILRTARFETAGARKENIFVSAKENNKFLDFRKSFKLKIIFQ